MPQRNRLEVHESSENQKRAIPKNSSRKRLVISKRVHDMVRIDNASSLSMATSTFKGNSITEHELGSHRPDEVDNLGMGYFTEKYLARDAPQQDLDQEMRMVLGRKQNELASLRIYRDELKLINFSRPKNQTVKLSVQTLKQKAEVEQKIYETQVAVEKQLKNIEREIQLLAEYGNFMTKCLETKGRSSNDVLDMGHEEQVMVNNLQMETAHLMNELTEEQRKNTRDIRQIQDEIKVLRIFIQQKQDKLRQEKAKICTMYIKLHSRASSRTGSKSKDRNMSLSVRKKFISQNNQSIRQAYIGNNAFKNYSRQIMEIAESEDELVRIKFFTSGFQYHNETNPKQRQQFSFQCIYKSKEGVIHRQQQPPRESNPVDDDATRDKISETSSPCEQILVKYLFSMKFFYKSKIVGVQCRVKTERGNKHIQIGNCDPSIEHELLTLVNKRLVTMGSFWHGKEMIGVSVWYSEKQKTEGLKASSSRSIKGLGHPGNGLGGHPGNGRPGHQSRQKLQTYDEYYV